MCSKNLALEPILFCRHGRDLVRDLGHVRDRVHGHGRQIHLGGLVLHFGQPLIGDRILRFSRFAIDKSEMNEKLK